MFALARWEQLMQRSAVMPSLVGLEQRTLHGVGSYCWLAPYRRARRVSNAGSISAVEQGARRWPLHGPDPMRRVGDGFTSQRRVAGSECNAMSTQPSVIFKVQFPVRQGLSDIPGHVSAILDTAHV